ncbi:hypothetical protein [Sinomicrobium sp.]
MAMLDFFGQKIQVGDLVAYGKANRNNPLGVGKVIEINEDDGYWGSITVQGVKNSKPGTLSAFQVQNKIVVLPEDYHYE